MAPIPEVDKIWMDGELVAWAEAKVHVLTHALHYGSGVFEGIRCYKTAEGPAVFRLTEHLERLVRSAKLYSCRCRTRVEELFDATFEVIEATGSRRATSARWSFAVTATWVCSHARAGRRHHRRLAVGHLSR